MMDAINTVIFLLVGFVLFVGLIVLHIKIFFPFYTKEEMEQKKLIEKKSRIL